MISYRKMTTADIPEGLRLCREANWNQVERDWQVFLQLSPDACRVAVSPDKVVGTVTTVSYQQAFSWIGMVLVDTANQRQGIGMKLLQEALHILKDANTIKLDATPAGKTVYLKLGFVDEYAISRMQANTIDRNKLEESSTAQPVSQQHLSALIAFDQSIFGADRTKLLQWMWNAAPEHAFFAMDQNKMQGYCLGRNGHNFTHIGPVVANDLATAKNIVSAALQNSIAKPVILDAMHFEPAWLEWLEEIGFRLQRPLTRMYRGSNHFPGLPEKQFAILGPEFG